MLFYTQLAPRFPDGAITVFSLSVLGHLRSLLVEMVLILLNKHHPASSFRANLWSHVSSQVCRPQAATKYKREYPPSSTRALDTGHTHLRKPVVPWSTRAYILARRPVHIGDI